MARTPRPRTLVRWLVGVAALYVVVAAGLLLLARHQAIEGLDTLDEARDDLTPADLLHGEGEAVLRDARGDFSAAHTITQSALFAPLRALPVLGRQLRSFDALAGGARDITSIGADALQEARAQLGGSLPQGPARVAVLRELGAIAARTRDRVVAVDLGPDDALLGPLASARDDFAEQVGDLQDGLDRTAAAADGMASLLEGPSTYLLLASNNAEMRAGSGMFLSAGLLTIQGGQLALGDMISTNDLFLARPAPIVDTDLADRWGWARPDQEWRNLGLSPRFDVTAEQASRMWQAAGGPPVDGVLGVDVLALQALLAATGPVEVEGETIDTDNVQRILLHDQYVGVDPSDQSGRRERLAAVAKATVERIDGADADLAAMADALRVAARGRHLLAWGRPERAAEHAAWEAAGVAGTLADDSVLVAVLNRGQNKLDQFLKVDATLDVTEVDDGTDVVLRIDLANETPPGEPPYVSGLDPALFGGPGVYSGFLSVDVPRAASTPTVDGVDVFTAAGADGATSQVVAVPVELAPGAGSTAIVRFHLPDGVTSLRIEPSARAPSVSWHAVGPQGVRDWTDTDGAQRVTW